MTKIPKYMLPHDPADLHIAAEIDDAPDRICAILGLAYLDEKLTMALEGQLVKDKSTAKKLFRPNGPIGAFGTKAELGYMLGLYSVAVRDDLLVLAEIRNMFAHFTKLIDFGSRDIYKRCEALDGFRNAFTLSENFFPKPFNRATARKRWIYAISVFSQHMEIMGRNRREIGEPQL